MSSASAVQQLQGAVEEALTRLIISNDENTTTVSTLSLTRPREQTNAAAAAAASSDADEEDEPFVPVICNRVGWWTHRAMNDVAAVDIEATQLTIMALHLVANHHAVVIGSAGTPVLSVLCGSEQLATQLRARLRAEQQPLIDPAQGLVVVRSVDEAVRAAAPTAASDATARPLCSVFAFGGFPAAHKSRRFDAQHALIAGHFRSGAEYRFLVGHFFWPECDGPLRPSLSSTRKKLLDMRLHVAPFSAAAPAAVVAGGGSAAPAGVQRIAAVAVPDSQLFSPCLALRCPRHADQVALLTCGMPLQEMKALLRCNRLCRLPLRCGHAKHLCTERCHGLAEHAATRCPFPCAAKVAGCEHPCRMLCEEPCDCLKAVKRDRDCGHVTLKGHLVRHRFEGSCTQSHATACQISVPVRCAHCYGISHIACYEAQQTIKQQQQQQQQNNEEAGGEQVPPRDDDIPTMPADTFKCADCRDVEFRVRSQVKLELQREAEEEKRETRREAQRHRVEQEKAAQKGIFRDNQQVVITKADAVLDADLAAGLFGDAAGAGVQWLRDVPAAELVNVVGTVVARQGDVTDPTVMLYILALATHGGHVAVADTGLALVRAVYKTDAEHNRPMLMLEYKKPATAAAPSSGNGEGGPSAAEIRAQAQLQHLMSLEAGTRVVVLRGTFLTESLSDDLIDVFYDRQQQQQHEQQQQQQQGDAAAIPSFADLFGESDEEDVESGSDERPKEDGVAAAAPDSAMSTAAKRASLPKSIPIANVIGSVISYEQQQQQQQDAEGQEPATMRAKVWVDLVAYFGALSSDAAAAADGGAGTRRDRDPHQQQQQQLAIGSEEVLVEVLAEPQALVPLFTPGTVVRVREPQRHVLDPLERDKFRVKPHHNVAASSSSASGGSPASPLLHGGSSPGARGSGLGGGGGSSSGGVLFVPHQLPAEARCTIQGYVNAPKASHAAFQQDQLLRTASRRGPCYLVSLVTASSSTNSGRHHAARVAIVPVFFADLDTDEIADQAVARKIREELELRCAERIEAAVEDRYLANRESDERRLKAVAELQRREQQALARKLKNQQQQTAGEEAPVAPVAPSRPAAASHFVTARILQGNQATRAAETRYLAAKRFALTAHGAMLDLDAKSAAAVSVQQIAQTFARERAVDTQLRTTVMSRVQ